MLRATRKPGEKKWTIEELPDTDEEMEREMARCAIEYFDPTRPATRSFPLDLWLKIKPRS